MSGIEVEVVPGGKALKRLVDAVAAGAGALFLPWQMRRLAHANVDVAKIHAKGARQLRLLEAQWDREEVLDGEIVESTPLLLAVAGSQTLTAEEEDEPDPIPLMRRAARHSALRSAQRQANAEAVVAEAAAEVRSIPDEEVTDRPVDPTFASRLFDYAQDASEDRVRTMWAKLLVDEVRHGEGSLRALEVLKTLSADEARNFERLARCATIDGAVSVGANREVDGLTLGDLLSIAEAGLLSANLELVGKFELGGESLGARSAQVLQFPMHVIRVTSVGEYEGHLPVLRLTAAGQVIARSLALETDFDWLKKACDRIKRAHPALRVFILGRTGPQSALELVPLYEAQG